MNRVTKFFWLVYFWWLKLLMSYADDVDVDVTLLMMLKVFSRVLRQLKEGKDYYNHAPPHSHDFCWNFGKSMNPPCKILKILLSYHEPLRNYNHLKHSFFPLCFFFFESKWIWLHIMILRNKLLQLLVISWKR